MANSLKKLLEEIVHSDARVSMSRRLEAMVRELEYLRTKKDLKILVASRAGWTQERIKIILQLNCFYQVVVGPLAGSVRVSKSGLGREVPITHGKIRFDAIRHKHLGGLHSSFRTIVEKSGIPWKTMSARTTKDVVFILWRDVDERQR